MYISHSNDKSHLILSNTRSKKRSDIFNNNGIVHQGETILNDIIDNDSKSFSRCYIRISIFS